MTDTAIETAEPRLKRHYQERVRPKLMEEFGFGNVHQVPRIERVILNVGMGEVSKNQKLLDAVLEELGAITGQRPVVTRARKSVAGFDIREGWPVGARVTLRRSRMYEFLDRLISITMPRIRDFQGIPARSFDGRGNYTLGVKEQIIFPEIEYDDVGRVHGMDVTVTTTTDRDDEAYALLREMGFPFRGEVPVQIGAGVD